MSGPGVALPTFRGVCVWMAAGQDTGSGGGTGAQEDTAMGNETQTCVGEDVCGDGFAPGDDAG